MHLPQAPVFAAKARVVVVLLLQEIALQLDCKINFCLMAAFSERIQDSDGIRIAHRGLRIHYAYSSFRLIEKDMSS